MGRTPSHTIETKARDYVRNVIDNYYKNGDALFRDLSERDYGIDALVELFFNGDPTGKIALIQIKGTEKPIKKQKKKDVVACSISATNAMYAKQNNVPIFLLYATLAKPENIYYVDINKAIQNEDEKRLKNKKNITIHIPINNNVSVGLEPLFETIHDFYSRR